MDIQLCRLTRIRQLFQNGHGRGLYHNRILQGEPTRKPAILCAYLGLYADKPYLQFTTVQTPAPQFRSAANQAISYTLQPDTPPEQAQLYALNEESRALLNVRLWHIASSGVYELGLPVAFLAYVTTKQDNTSKVIFWYRQNVPASWLLNALQRQIIRELNN